MQSVQKLENYFEHTIIEIVANLHADKSPVWGIMNASTMIDHLSDALKLSIGEFKITDELIMENAQKYKLITLTSDRAIPKGFDNPILKLLPKSTPIELDEAIKNLYQNVQLFKQKFKDQSPSYTTPHNIFGYLNYHEWLWFHYKHFSHHFAQFELIPYISRFELQ